MRKTAAGNPKIGRRHHLAQLLLNNSLQQPDGIETDLGTAIGKLRQNL